MKLILLLSILILSGCATGPVEIPRAGIGPEVENRNTAVFIAIDLDSKINRLSQIYAIDGVGADCLMYGCPAWIRVAPGDHSFTVVFSHTHELSFDVAAKDMKAGRIYVARRDESTGEIKVSVEELPAGANYGLGMKADGSFQYPITF